MSGAPTKVYFYSIKQADKYERTAGWIEAIDQRDAMKILQNMFDVETDKVELSCEMEKSEWDETMKRQYQGD